MPQPGFRQHTVNELPVVPTTGFDVRELFTPDGLFHNHPEIQSDARKTELATIAFELQGLIAESREKSKQIQRDKNFSPDGQRERLDKYFRELAGKISGDVGRYLRRDEIESIQRRRTELNMRRLELPKHFKSEAATGALERETRDQLRELADIQRKQLLIEAADQDDRITLRAFQYAPPRFPLVDPDSLQNAAWLHARRRFPEQVEDIEDAERLVSALRSNLEKCLGILRELAAAGTQEVADLLRPGKIIPDQVDAGDNPYLDPMIARPTS